MISLSVNGTEQRLEVSPDMRPAVGCCWDILGLTGAKFGCGHVPVRVVYRPPGRRGGAQVEANLRTELATTKISLTKWMVTIMTAYTAAMTALARSLGG